MRHDYTPAELRLAQEIAATLKDEDSLAMHLQLVRTYTEEHLRSVLHKVMSLPEDKIKKSRAALYTFLINQQRRHGRAGY
jgi:hypothetical protein